MSGLVQHYGLLALFVIVMLESGGVPLPGETALIAAGIFASRGRLDIAAVIAVAATAAIVGDNLGYWIGRTGGRRLLDRWGRVTRVSERALPWAEGFFQRHGAKTIFLGALLLDPARDRRLDGRRLAHALVDVLRLERGRRDLLGAARRARRLLRRPRGRRRDLPLRADRRRRDRRCSRWSRFVGFHFWRKRLVESP